MGLRRLRPGFWTAAEATGPYTGLFNYRRVWWLAVALLAAVSLIPLCIMTVIDFGVTKRSVNQENLHRTTITTSNTRHTLADFLTERLAALTFVASDAPYPALVNHDRLAAVLQNLKTGFGGFMDLGVIDDTGRQVAYIGPYPLLGIDYSGQDWFKQTARTGHCISDVFLGFRNAPHFIIAVRSELPDGHFFMLRATLDTQRINDILANLDLSGNGDAFLVNREGILQTVSRSHGTVFDHLPFSLPPLPPTTKVILTAERIIGCAPIDGTPLVLLVVKRQAALMQTWYAARLNLIGFLAASVVVILVVIMGVAAQMVEKIFLADQTRAKAMRQMELTNRMASIGRLAAGVAHEINNPLAIINEKAGLIKDLLLFGQAQCSNAEKLIGLVDSVIALRGPGRHHHQTPALLRPAPGRPHRAREPAPGHRGGHGLSDQGGNLSKHRRGRDGPGGSARPGVGPGQTATDFSQPGGQRLPGHE